LLRELPRQTLPFDLFAVPRYYDHIVIVPFSRLMKVYDLTFSEVINYLSSTDACTMYSPVKKRYIIYYNDLDSSFMTSNRYRFSIAHEFGHIFLEHLHDERTRIDQGIVSEIEYRRLERQADKFASYLLCPFGAFKERSVWTSADIRRICMISSAAADIAFNDFRAWLSRRGAKNIGELKYLRMQEDDFDDSMNSKFAVPLRKEITLSFTREEFEEIEDRYFERMLESYLAEG
ncbi:MAG: ImmA/IrrE family metallo-endopeptidase, partial [Filifactor alocis]|nr:ImmA/IrrE family metallo-endopeptidase [Filifactor alocis]